MIASLAIIVAGHARTIALPALLRGRPLSPNSRSFIPRSLSTPQGPNFTGYTPLATLTSCIRHANRLIALETPKLDIMRTKPSQCRTTVHVHVIIFYFHCSHLDRVSCAQPEQINANTHSPSLPPSTRATHPSPPLSFLRTPLRLLSRDSPMNMNIQGSGEEWLIDSSNPCGRDNTGAKPGWLRHEAVLQHAPRDSTRPARWIMLGRGS
jgi:hypothetical protein